MSPHQRHTHTDTQTQFQPLAFSGPLTLGSGGGASKILGSQKAWAGTEDGAGGGGPHPPRGFGSSIP